MKQTDRGSLNSRAPLVEANAVTKSVASLSKRRPSYTRCEMVRYRGFTVADQVTTHELIILREDCIAHLAKYQTDDWRDFIVGIETMLQLHCL